MWAAAVDLTALVQSVIGALLAGAGIYAGIRADLARTNERATTALARADAAHERIDEALRERSHHG